MGKYIGIDFGLLYCGVSYLDENGTLNIVDSAEGSPCTPSVVYIMDDEIQVGEIASVMRGETSGYIAERVKWYMNDTECTYYMDGTDYSPADISALIFSKLLRDTQDFAGDKVEGAVITVPPYFTKDGTNALLRAAGKAGIKVLGLLDEATAAAIAYGYSLNRDFSKTILVYDLGGSFKCTVIKVEFDGGKYSTKIIASDYDTYLGGSDWDGKITELAIKKFCSKTGADPDEMMSDAELTIFFTEQSEKIKKLLSVKASTPMVVNYDGQKEKLDITREEFESLSEELLSLTVRSVDRMLSENNISVMHDIDEILIVGGSCRMPQVKERLINEYGLPVTSYEADKTVAVGAAIEASRYAKK